MDLADSSDNAPADEPLPAERVLATGALASSGAFPVTADDIVIGLWVSQATMARVPNLLRTWYNDGDVVLLGVVPNAQFPMVALLTGIGR